jgi:hypothetical protein
MTGKILSSSTFAILFGLMSAVFAIIAGYRGLIVYTNPIVAPVAMAAICAAAALGFIVVAQIRAARRRAQLTTMMSTLIDHKSLAELASTVIVSASARFGVKPEDLSSVFALLIPSPQDEPQEQVPDPSSKTYQSGDGDVAATVSVSKAPSLHPSSTNPSIH